MVQDAIPLSLDIGFYKNQIQAAGMTDEEAVEHFYLYGKEKGVAGSPLCDLGRFIAWCNAKGGQQKQLEIGPGHIARLIGPNVRYTDVYDSEGLRKRAASYNLPTDKVPEVIHYVTDHGELDNINEQFSLVFSCHNIEHEVDLIQHLNQIHQRLLSGGIFACVCPDKRYTFDYFRQLTTEYEIIEQHFSPVQAGRHPMHTWLESTYVLTHNDSVAHWKGEHGDINLYKRDLSSLIEQWNGLTSYVDMHRWIFTDDSFRRIMTILYDLKLIKLKLIRVYNTQLNSNGFQAVFTREE